MRAWTPSLLLDSKTREWKGSCMGWAQCQGLGVAENKAVAVPQEFWRAVGIAGDSAQGPNSPYSEH